MTMQQARQSTAAQDPLTPPVPLWIREDGFVACSDHLDEHAAQQAARGSRTVQVFSEGGPWFKLNRGDLAEFLMVNGAPMVCGQCERARW